LFLLFRRLYRKRACCIWKFDLAKFLSPYYTISSGRFCY